MNELEYTYAVARIRALEASLLTDSVIDQLLACKDEAQCLGLLSEKGWGNAETENDVEAILNCEEEKTWQVIQLQTRDGQLCDVIVDCAALEAITQAGHDAKDEIIRVYAESTVALANIKIAVRCQKTGKSLEFMKRAMAPCESINVEQLAKAALSGADALREYLKETVYADGVEALEESPSAFERWCDNQMIEAIKPQKYNAFSAGPLVAYLLARQNEIKTVRMILTGKQNGFPDEMIRERIREMYV
ncbi:V-type sodium pump subunit C [Dorea longicatena]|nr:V-type sodium pump subunit C [Dorea longicatena]